MVRSIFAQLALSEHSYSSLFLTNIILNTELVATGTPYSTHTHGIGGLYDAGSEFAAQAPRGATGVAGTLVGEWFGRIEVAPQE